MCDTKIEPKYMKFCVMLTQSSKKIHDNKNIYGWADRRTCGHTISGPYTKAYMYAHPSVFSVSFFYPMTGKIHLDMTE